MCKLGNIVTGNDVQTQMVLDRGVLTMLRKFYDDCNNPEFIKLWQKQEEVEDGVTFFFVLFFILIFVFVVFFLFFFFCVLFEI